MMEKDLEVVYYDINEDQLKIVTIGKEAFYRYDYFILDLTNLGLYKIGEL